MADVDAVIDQSSDPGSMQPDIEKAATKAFQDSTRAMDTYQARLKAETPVLEARGKSLQAIIDSMPEHAPVELPKAPQTQAQPKPPEFEPIQNFGSAASVLGIIGSMLLKQPISTALNASAAAMKARNQNDWANYEANYKAWKDSTDQAWKQANWEQQHFADAVELMKTDSTLGMAKFNAIAGLTQNDAARIAYESGDPKLMAEYAGSLAKLSESMKSSQLKVEELAMREQYYKWLETGGKMGNSLGALRAHAAALRTQADALAPDDPNRASLVAAADSIDKQVKTEETAQANKPSQLSPAAIDLAAQTYLTTGQMPSLGFSAAGDRQAILNKAGELAAAQHSTVGDILAGRAAYKADSSSLANLQKTADAGQSFEETMLKNIEIVKGLMNKGAGTEAGPVVNRWLQAGKIATGDPDVKAFAAAIDTVMDEYAKILSGNTSGAQRITDAAREQTEGMIGKFDSPRAIMTTLDKVVIPDSNNRIASYREQLEEIRGRLGGGPGKPPGASQPAPAPTQSKFTKGSVYTDAQGNKAEYLGGDPGSASSWHEIRDAGPPAYRGSLP